MSWSRVLLIGLLAAAAPAGSVAAEQPLSQHDLMLLNRITWGATPADAAEMQKLGPRRWLERQLHPSRDDGLPQGVQAVIGDLTAVKEPMTQVLEGCSCRSSQRRGPSFCISAASAGVAPQVTRFSSIRSCGVSVVSAAASEGAAAAAIRPDRRSRDQDISPILIARSAVGVRGWSRLAKPGQASSAMRLD